MGHGISHLILGPEMHDHGIRPAGRLLQQVLGKIQARIREPERLFHLFSVHQYALATLAEHTTEIPDIHPESLLVGYRPGMQVKIAIQRQSVPFIHKLQKTVNPCGPDLRIGWCP